MLTYRGLIDDATQQLYDSSELPRIDAEVLLQHVIERPMSWLIAYGDTTATSPHVQSFYELVAKRQQGQPIAYLTGKRDFWTLTLDVNENVLIPRSDTENLVEQALERIPTDAAWQILDLGTGSGAIGLALAKERPNCSVLAIDSQDGALRVAQKNGVANGVTNIEFRQSDWFESLCSDNKFDLIASNPPYIEKDDSHLQQGDLRFEPLSALVASNDGLSDLQTIIKTAPNYLSKNGWLIVEHGYNQAEPVAECFRTYGFEKTELHRDINDLPRCTSGQLS